MQPPDNFETNDANTSNPPDFISGRDAVAVYTVLSILVKMEHTLGLEAMLEYIETYLCVIEQHNPHLKYAVSRALQMISVEKIYKEAVYRETS